MDNSTALIWLSGIEGLNGKPLERLLEAFPEPEALWEEPLQARPLLSARMLRALCDARSEALVDELLAGLEEKGVRALTLLDDSYPARLRGVEDAPPVLYARGELPSEERAAAVVGSRRCTADGRLTAGRMGRELGESGVCVISGLAEGIDSAAHVGCLEGGGQAVAVLGCAIDGCYPPENRALLERILEEGGCVLSEHAPGKATRAYHFSQRNRIISGLSQAVVVVEAGEKSGALITAQYAERQGRMLFAVPGSIYSQASRGSNRLLTRSARAALSAEEVFAEMGWRREAERTEPEQAPELDPQSRRVVEFLQNDEKSFDEIVNQLKIPAGELNSLLTILEMQGIIRQSAGRLYRSVLPL